MTLTALDIQQKKFPTRWKGADPREVEAFLSQAADAFEALRRDHQRLEEEAQKLQSDVAEYRKREGAFKLAILQSQKVIDQMLANARKQAELVVAEAENKAARLLQQSQNRLAQLQEEILDLKRQRVQFEIEIGAVVESHRRLLATHCEKSEASDEQDGKLKVLKPQK